MELRLDLHIHSHHSPDGSMTAEEIALRAREAGCNGVAFCDHDRTFPASERETPRLSANRYVSNTSSFR